MGHSLPGSFVNEDSPGKNTGVGGWALLQGIFPTQGLNPTLLYLLHWQVDSSPQAPLGKPRNCPIGWHKAVISHSTHSSFLVWKIPWTEEPGGLQSIGSQRDRHVWKNCPIGWYKAIISQQQLYGISQKGGFLTTSWKGVECFLSAKWTLCTLLLHLRSRIRIFWQKAYEGSRNLSSVV